MLEDFIYECKTIEFSVAKNKILLFSGQIEWKLFTNKIVWHWTWQMKRITDNRYRKNLNSFSFNYQNKVLLCNGKIVMQNAVMFRINCVIWHIQSEPNCERRRQLRVLPYQSEMQQMLALMTDKLRFGNVFFDCDENWCSFLKCVFARTHILTNGLCIFHDVF